MSRFENSYLAESVGYNNGHSNGVADGMVAGRKQGYTEGWNAATTHGNRVIAELKQEIDRLLNEVHKGNAHIKELRAGLEKSHHVSELYHTERDELGMQIDKLKHQLLVQQEKTQDLQARHEEMFKAFLGVVAIAIPAVELISKLPVAEKEKVILKYGDEAVKQQSKPYIDKHSFPHKQPLIKQYMPISYQVINNAINEINAEKSKKSTDTFS